MFIIIFIRPQLEPKEEKESLMSIIEEGFYTATEWTVKETPVVVTKLMKTYTEAGVTQPSRVFINHSKSYQGILTPTPSSKLTISGNNPWVIECSVTTCTNEQLTLIVVPIDIHTPNLPLLDIRCVSPTGNICDASIGATLSTKGVSDAAVTQLTTKGYETLKNEWNFPSDKEFAILINGNPTIASSSSPTGNVYVKEKPYWKSDSHNIRTPITITFKAW
jgi:hypothetical protein